MANKHAVKKGIPHCNAFDRRLKLLTLCIPILPYVFRNFPTGTLIVCLLHQVSHQEAVCPSNAIASYFHRLLPPGKRSESTIYENVHDSHPVWTLNDATLGLVCN